MLQQTYLLTVHSWKTSSEPILIRCSRTEELIASFPLEFVQRSGDDSWQYVLDVVNQLVELSPGHPPTIRDSAGVPVQMAEHVSGGIYWYEQAGQSFKHLSFTTASYKS
jgi:hypothetical protein